MSRGDDDQQPDATRWIDDVSALWSVRELIADVVADCEDTRLDAAIVISELVTNAFEHGGAPTVGVELRRVDRTLHGTVISSSDDHPRTFEPHPTLPAADDPRGRGLVIARALTTAYQVWIADGYRYDWVSFDVGERTID